VDTISKALTPSDVLNAALGLIHVARRRLTLRGGGFITFDGIDLSGHRFSTPAFVSSYCVP